MLWKKYLIDLTCPSVKENKTIDTLIIGGGIAGLSTLYFLNNDQTFLVESKTVGSGVTMGTTGKITYLQQDILYKLLINNWELASNYLRSQKDAINLLKTIIKRENIACDLDKSSSMLLTNKEKDLKKIDIIYQFLKTQKINVKYTEYQNLYGIKVNDTYTFNPIKFLEFLKIKLQNKIYENTKIINIKKCNEGYLCLTEKGYTIRAKKVIVTCQYPFFLKPLWLPASSTIEKSSIIVVKEKTNSHVNYITYSKPILSYRTYEDGNNIYGIYLSCSHNPTFKENDKCNQNKVIKAFKLANKDVIYSWTNMDIMMGDNLPLIGKVDNNLYIATGFNTWGMTNGIISGKIISEEIINNKVMYNNIFNPGRIKKYQKFYKSFTTNLIAFIKGIKPNKKWYDSVTIDSNNVGTVKVKGKKYYVKTICPHLKCPLLFNEVDKTWDCPCHSSRFTYDGKWLKGPSKKNITLKK